MPLPSPYSLSNPILPSPGHFPAFPVETLANILSFLPNSSLVNTAQVSTLFLELSAPLLYLDIKLIGLGKLFQFFTHRVSSSSLPLDFVLL